MRPYIYIFCVPIDAAVINSQLCRQNIVWSVKQMIRLFLSFIQFANRKKYGWRSRKAFPSNASRATKSDVKFLSTSKECRQSGHTICESVFFYFLSVWLHLRRWVSLLRPAMGKMVTQNGYHKEESFSFVRVSKYVELFEGIGGLELH